MDYRTARTQIQDGDLLAFEGRSVFSWLIRCVTGSAITHVGFAMWVRRRLCVLEAMEGRGVRLVPLSDRLRNGAVVHWSVYSSQIKTRQEVVTHAIAQWGKQYASPWQLLRSFGWLSRRISDRMGWRSDTDPERFFCSELIAASLGWAYAPRVSPGIIAGSIAFTPQGVLEWP